MFEIYACDTETTGLGPNNEIIELTLYRLSDDTYKTWCLKPLNIDAIQKEALQVNGHKLEDLLHKTSEGRARYKDPASVLVEIENWLAEDNIPSDNRIILAHNAAFDRTMLLALWDKHNASGSFPFNPKYIIDTMQIQFFIEYMANDFGDGFSLNNLCKKYKVKNEKAHSSEADTKALVSIFRAQVDKFKNENTVRSE